MKSSDISSVLKKIATGPHLSKNLTEQEAYEAMQGILARQVNDVQAGVFFIALRMKRESAQELTGVFRAMLEAEPCESVDVPELVTLADQYSGYARGLPASPFIPAVLSALDIPSVTHSPEVMSPKYGLTSLTVLQACGIPACESLPMAATALKKSGWVVLDQRTVTPKSAALNELRDLIVKRPCLSTLECCIRPLHTSGKNYLLTGYVHKPYPPIYAMCADVAGFDSATFVRGVEGGIIPSVAQSSRYFPWHRATGKQGAINTPEPHNLNTANVHADVDACLNWSDEVPSFEDIELVEVTIDPANLGIVRSQRAEPWPKVDISDHQAASKCCAELGMKALQGNEGVMRDGIRIGAAVAVAGLRDVPLNSALTSVDAALESGEAWRSFAEKRTLA